MSAALRRAKVRLVHLGPLAGSSARAWLSNAKRVVALARASSDPALSRLPDEVADAFDGFLDEWLALAAGADEFVWEGEVDPDAVRPLAAYWFHLAKLVAERADELHLPVAPPEAEPFYLALVSAMTDVLLAEDDPDHFGDKVREMWPLDRGATTPAPPRQAPLRVLLVDDTADVRLLLRFALQHDDRFVVVGEAAHGLEALEFCDGHECPDVVLLDLMMPVMDGVTALPLLKQACPDARVFVLTATASQVDAAEIERLGAERVLDKSAPLSEVTAALVAA